MRKTKQPLFRNFDQRCLNSNFISFSIIYLFHYLSQEILVYKLFYNCIFGEDLEIIFQHFLNHFLMQLLDADNQDVTPL